MKEWFDVKEQSAAEVILFVPRSSRPRTIHDWQKVMRSNISL